MIFLGASFVSVLQWIGYILVALLCLMFMIVVHEAGHYIVGRKSGKLLDWKGIAISILPAEEYLGITVERC